ncbi:MAG: response regulator [Candidatus Omnitrophica bacterium]|nr:response regulator [Candidatus Omnitrophota bacterium]
MGQENPKKYVLLVDDEKDFVEPIAYWLRSRGYEVATAEDGRGALDGIASRRPDIVFMDINMPGMDGLEALRKIRETDKDLPVILLTAAFGDESKIVTARSLGVSGFFAKNYTFEQLMQVLQVALKMHRHLPDGPQEDAKKDGPASS